MSLWFGPCSCGCAGYACVAASGTVLQPGINLLERAEDFPPTAPILVITDGYCDVVRVRREHAFLVPESARLPFTPRGPVFRLRPAGG